MQAVILAGGLGTRLWPLTREVPKPMIPVAGAPYLEHQLRLLSRQGVQQILLLTGYLGQQIERYFGDGRQLGLEVYYSREPSPLGTGGALRHARQLVAETFLLIYGDSFLPIRYDAPLKLLSASSSEAVVVVYDNRLADTGVISNMAVSESGLVTRYCKDALPAADLHYVEAGVQALRKSVLDLIPTTGSASLEKDVFPHLIARRSLRAHLTQQRFYDIGTPERLREIEQYLTTLR